MTGPISATANTVTLNKLVNLDLNGQNLTGNVTITSGTSGTLNISAGTITGNLTVDAANATVNNAATVSGTITINNVSGNTWNENASNNNIVFNDPNADTNLVIGANQTVSSLTLKTPAKVSVSTGATVTALTVEAGAANTAISNSGTITTVTANGNTSLKGTAPSTVYGTGTITGDALPSAPENAVKEIVVNGLLASDIKYLAFNLNNNGPGTESAQKISTLEEVKSFVSNQYGAILDTTKITVVDGKITVADGLLTTENWNKVKMNGNKVAPYQITVLNKDKTSKIAKIAMYQNGTVSIIALP
ncbi:hypothetical protein [Sporosarcina sp. D27]|uniref:hypothetical protein n=1 Tax=Sporosarcina sp. D27 TaxID=1382305 RepID=UPI00046EA303|nr:hypothetical protein [Sporosarcina sp. D27]